MNYVRLLLVLALVGSLSSCMKNMHKFEGSYVLKEDEGIFLHFVRNDRAVTNANPEHRPELYRISRTDADISLILVDRTDQQAGIPDFEIYVHPDGYILNSLGTNQVFVSKNKRPIQSATAQRP